MYGISLRFSFIQRLFFQGLLACLMSCAYITSAHASMPPMSPKEQADFEEFMASLDTPEGQKLLKDIEAQYNALTPEEKEELERQTREALKNAGIDPDTYQPIEPSQPLPLTPTQPTPTAQAPAEPVPDCSQETTHSCQEVETLLQRTISYLDIVRQKLGLLHLETTTIQEWLGALAYYLKIMNNPDHIKRLSSVDFTQLFDLIAELEVLLRNEATALVVIPDDEEEESRSDDPYAILGIPYDATNEEITKAYEQEFAENDPETLKKELELSKTDYTKITKRMRRATARQATLTDAYKQLSDPQLRQQLDRSRSHTQEQQLALRTTNIESTERLHDGLNKLVQQGLIKKLEDFFTRYAPTELKYYQNMEESEKKRIDEQRAAAGLKPAPSPLGGGSPFGGYQSPYYPGNDYFSRGGYQPSFTPQAGGGFGGGSGGSGANAPSGGEKSKDGGKDDKKKDEKKDDKKKDEGKKDDKKKKDGDKKDKKDDVDAIAKEFKKRLNDLKGPLSKFKDYLEADAQEDVRTRLMSLTEPRTKATKAITDASFNKLHEGLRNFIKPELITKLQHVATFVGEKIAGNKNKKVMEECLPIWEAHVTSLSTAYVALDIICQHAMPALRENPNLGQVIPWNNVHMLCQILHSLKNVFKKPESKEKEEGAKKAKQTAQTKKPSQKEREEKTKEEEQKKKTPPTAEEIQAAVQAVKVACEKVKSNIEQDNNKEKLEKLTRNLEEAIAATNYDGVKQLKIEFDTLLTVIGFDEFTQLQSLVHSMQQALPDDVDKEAVIKLIKDAKISKKTYPLIYEIQSINKEIKQFLSPEPKQEEARSNVEDPLTTKILNVLNTASRPKAKPEKKRDGEKPVEIEPARATETPEETKEQKAKREADQKKMTELIGNVRGLSEYTTRAATP